MKTKNKKNKKTDKFNIEVNCQTCGQPITYSDKFGMFCDNRCGYETAKKSAIELDNFCNVLADAWEHDGDASNEEWKALETTLAGLRQPIVDVFPEE